MPKFPLTAAFGAAFSCLLLVSCAATLPDISLSERVREATVLVASGTGHGAGVLIAPDRVLTARHVVTMDEANIFFEPGVQTVGIVTWRSESADLAVLEIEPMAGSPVDIDCAAPRAGMPVVIMGHSVQSRPWLLRHGYIASADMADDGTVTLDLPSRPGDSGAGVFAPDGRLVGIIDGYFRSVVLSPYGEFMGFASMVAGSVLCRELGL